MNSKSNLVSKCLTTQAITEDEKASGTADDIAGSASGGSQVATSKEVDNTFANVFTADILPEIFDNLRILTAKDLLQFRLVNRCWRDAATPVLLKRNLCKLPLCFGIMVLDKDDNLVARGFRSQIKTNKFNSYKYFNFYKPGSFLSDLNQLISISPKFPSTSIGIYPVVCPSGFEDLCSIPNNPDAIMDEYHKDLLQFLSLHGKKMRKLSLTDGVSKKALQNLLYVHMPNLTSLDIQYFDFEYKNRADEASQSQIPVCLPPPSTLQIKEIIVGAAGPPESKFNFVKELTRSSPNLIAIQDIQTSLLGGLLEIGKCHLVKDAYFDLLYLTPQFTKLVTDTILKGSLPNVPTFQLTKLTVKFKDRWEGSNTNDVMIKGLNLILSASKDSLKHLKLTINPTDNHVNIFIPPLPHLAFLELVCYKIPSTFRFHFRGDVLGQALKARELTADDSVNDFNELTRRNQGNINIPADYFPRLREMKLFSGLYENIFTGGDKLLEFFSLEHLEADGVTTFPSDTLPKVTSLQLSRFPRDGGNMSQVFPNISYLNIRLVSPDGLFNQNWVWSAFPQLQRFEICPEPFFWSTKEVDSVDSFFTGFSKELCATIERGSTSSEFNLGQGAVFKRTQPYIGDSKNLKEFKITFLQTMWSKFATKVTAVHGFKHVIHRTKIILSFEGPQMSVEEMKETHQYLEPVAAYVDIRIKK